MANGITLALVGATTMVGESILAALDSCSLKPSELFLVDGEEGEGESIRHKGKEYLVQPVADFDFSQADVTIFATASNLAAAFARKAVEDGSFVVDASGHFLDDETVPVVLPHINPDILESADGLVALPGAASAQLAAVLKPLHDAIGVQHVNATAMLAVSEMGKAGVDELSSQAVALFNMRDVKSAVFPQQVVFNAVPHAGAIDSNGVSLLEQQIADETRLLLGDNGLPVQVSAAWVPVFFGHSIALHIRLSGEAELANIEAILSDYPGIVLAESPSAVSPAANSDAIYVGRMRLDRDNPEILQLWIVADNIRSGIARNVISVAEILEKSLI